MQHTENYKLNIIETSDPFGPEALNENTRKLETELDAVRGEFAAADAAKADQTALDALTGRVGTLEQTGLVYTIDKYSGTGKWGIGAKNQLNFDFKPLVVLVCTVSANYGHYPWIRGLNRGRATDSTTVLLTWEEQSVSWYSLNSIEHQLNEYGTTYYYFALGIPV